MDSDCVGHRSTKRVYAVKLTEEQRKLIEQHLRLAQKLANAVRTNLSFSERFSAACWGLIDAAMKWTSDRGQFDKFASARIYGSIIDDTRRATRMRLKGKRKGESRETFIEDWSPFGDHDPRFDWIDNEEEILCWRKELNNRMHRLTAAQRRAIEMKRAGLVGNKVMPEHGVSANVNRTRLGEAIQRLKAQHDVPI